MVEQALPTSAERRATAPAGGRAASVLDRVPDFLASYLAFVAIFCAVTALVPALREPLGWLRTAIAFISVDAPPSLATAAFLGILAAAVRRRMRAAWWLLVAAVLLDRVLGGVGVFVRTESPTPVELLDDSDIVAIAVGLIVLALLIAARSRFTARTERGRGLRALGLYVALVVIGTLIGWGLLELLPGTLQTPADRFGWALTYVVAGLGDADLTGVNGTAPGR